MVKSITWGLSPVCGRAQSTIRKTYCAQLRILYVVHFQVNKPLCTMLTELEKALDTIIDIYHKYSLIKGNPHALYKDDLKKLLTNECPQYTKVRKGWMWMEFSTCFDNSQDIGLLCCPR